MLWSRFTFEVDTKKSKLIANQDQAFTSDGKFTDDTIHTLRLPDVSLILLRIYQKPLHSL